MVIPVCNFHQEIGTGFNVDTLRSNAALLLEKYTFSQILAYNRVCICSVPMSPSPVPEKKWGFSTGSAQTRTGPCLLSPFWGQRLLNSGSSSSRRNPPLTDGEGTHHNAEHKKGNGVATSLRFGLQPSRGKLDWSIRSQRVATTPHSAPTTLKCSMVCVSN